MINTDDLKARVDLLQLVERDTTLKKVASTGGGEYAGPCPFCGGRDRFRVQPARGRWFCRQCSDGRWGDAIAYVMWGDNCGFREACERLDPTLRGAQWIPSPAPTPRPAPRRARVDDAEPTAEWREQALEIVQGGEIALWSRCGGPAREWLNARGLRDETLKVWRIGYIHDAQEWHPGLYVPRGIVLPWFVNGQLWQVKMRRLSGEPKYTAVKGGHPLLFGADTLGGHQIAVLTEGEFDAMLLHQEAGDLVGVASLGSCSKQLSTRATGLLLPVPRLLVAYDTDVEGERGAARLAALSARMRPMPPPSGKDVTEFWQRGGQLRDWVAFHIEQMKARPLSPTG